VSDTNVRRVVVSAIGIENGGRWRLCGSRAVRCRAAVRVDRSARRMRGVSPTAADTRRWISILISFCGE